MLRKKAEQFEEFLQRAEQGEKAEEPWAGLVQTAQEVARLGPVPPPPRRLSPGRQRLLTEAVRLRESKRTQRRRVIPIMSRMKLASVVVAMLLFFAAVSGTGYALADNSLPGEPLYDLKGTFEQARVNLTRDPEAKAELAIHLAQQRMEEVATMLQNGQQVDPTTANRVQVQLRATVHAVEQVGEPAEQALMLRYQYMAQNQYRHMLAQLEDHPSDTTGAVDGLLRYMVQNRVRLQIEIPDGTAVQAQEQVQQGSPPDEVPAGSQVGAEDSPGPNEGAPFAGEGHYGPGAIDDLEPPEGPIQNAGDDPGVGYGPGEPPAGAPAWDNESPAQPPVDPGAGTGPATGDQTGDGAQIGDGVNGQNQNSTTGPGTGGVNSSGQDGGSDGGSSNDGGNGGGTSGGSGGGH